MRSVLVVSVVVLVVASAALADEGGFPYLGQVTGEDVRLRVGPSLNHRVLEMLPKGEKLVVDGADGDWLRVLVPGGVPCWVREDLLEKPAGGKVKVARTKVLMRPTPSTNYFPLEGRLDRGETLTVLGRRDLEGEPGWYQVLAPERIPVFIHGEFVAKVGDAPADLSTLAKDRLARLRGDETRVGGMDARRDDALRARIGKVEKALVGLAKGPEGDAALDGLERELKGILSEAEYELTKAQAASAYKDVLLARKQRDLVRAKTEAETTEEQLRAVIREADEKYRKALEELSKLAPVREMGFTSVGWVHLRRGAWVIEKGGIPLYLLTSRLFTIKDFAGKKVGVRGRMVGEDPKRGSRILEVESIEIFSN